MKTWTVIWIVLGALVLIAVGFGVGYVINGGLARPAMMGFYGPSVMPHMGWLGATRMGWLGLPFFGLGLLFDWVTRLGGIAGIIALILVLARRPATAAPTTPAEAPTVASQATSAKPSAKK